MAISQALQVSPDETFRRAGLLPPEPAAVTEEREIVAIIRDQPPATRRTLLSMLRGLTRKPTPPPDPIAAELLSIYDHLAPEWRPELVRAARMFELNTGSAVRVIGGENEPEREPPGDASG